MQKLELEMQVADVPLKFLLPCSFIFSEELLTLGRTQFSVEKAKIVRTLIPNLIQLLTRFLTVALAAR